MNHTDKQSPRDYIAARYEGYKNQVIRIKLYMDEELTDYHFALCDVNGKLIEAQNNYNDGIHLSFINDAKLSDGIYALVIVYMEKGLKKSSYLRNLDLLVPEATMGEAYDKRQLYRQRIRMEDDCSALLCYQPDQTLALEVCSDESKLYTNRIMNEVLMEIPYEDEKNGEQYVKLYVKSPMPDGNYLGFVDDEGKIVEYSNLETDKDSVYMSFVIPKKDYKGIKGYNLAWSKNRLIYQAPLKKKDKKESAYVSNYVYENGVIRLTLWCEADESCEYIESVLIHQAERWEKKQDYIPQGRKVGYKDGKIIIELNINTSELLKGIAGYNLCIRTKCQQQEKVYFVRGNGDVLPRELFIDGSSNYKYTFETIDGILQINHVYGHNAMTVKNLQPVEADYTLDDFLQNSEAEPKGTMHAEYVHTEDGKIKVKLYQSMSLVKEAKLVMLNTQGRGILSVQNLDVRNGIIKEFDVECPDVDWDHKFDKPINSVWFRLILAIRTAEGIYYLRLRNYDLIVGDVDKNIYDVRSLYYKAIGKRKICDIEMTALPYYGNNQNLSMKYVRNDQIYRSQFTNELLDVTIKKDILTIKMRCRECGGSYKGVLMEYRKVKEDDAESYLVPFDSLKEKNGWYIMTTKINMKEHYMRMLYWDIRCAFEIDGEIHTVSCHSNNRRFLRKYKNILVDRSYPNNNSIMFPYATGNDSVALMHRESCPQDHWRFRLKEKIAQNIYHLFQDHWDNKKIYLVFEKYCTMAQDNGFFFFKYCMDANVEAEFGGEIYYVIDPTQADWEKVLPYREHVLKFLSLKHLIYLQACRLMISTDTKGHAYVWRSMGSDIKALTYQKSLVFLQHGVTAFKRGHFERGTNVGCESFITTSQFEQNIINTYLGYPLAEIPITGFARWDVLHDKSEGHREILMMPTWRTWLDDAENEIFAESDYCKNYMALLNNPKLDEMLKAYDVTLNFYLHPKFRKFITEFSVVSDNIRLIPFGEEPLNELMMQCNLLITDFSSVAWDVYYMNKPVLFYHFDIEEASKTLGFYMDMKNDLFGDRAETPDQLMSLITEYIEKGFAIKREYAEQRSKYFTYVDDCNSERIWKAIREREW